MSRSRGKKKKKEKESHSHYTKCSSGSTRETHPSLSALHVNVSLLLQTRVHHRKRAIHCSLELDRIRLRDTEIGDKAHIDPEMSTSLIDDLESDDWNWVFVS